MNRRIIVCDGAELARLWSRIGAADSEELTWVPREDESRARPQGFRALQGGLVPEAIAKLNPKEGDVFGIVSEEPGFVRQAVAVLNDAVPQAPVLVLSDELEAGQLLPHRCLRLGRLRSLIRDDFDEEFDHLANLRRVTEIRDRKSVV